MAWRSAAMTLFRRPNLRQERRAPGEPGGINRVQVGCGPHNVLDEWWNVDVRPFPGIDQVMDATKPWPWRDLDYVYGEHFLEHLALDAALDFLQHAGNSLRRGGSIRLSTPNLDWVVATHYELGSSDRSTQVSNTLRLNRAFHGWGHRFLWSPAMLELVAEELGFEDVRFCRYGESEDAQLEALERHRNHAPVAGYASVVIVEATRGGRMIAIPADLRELLEQDFLRYVRSGH